MYIDSHCQCTSRAVNYKSNLVKFYFWLVTWSSWYCTHLVFLSTKSWLHEASPTIGPLLVDRFNGRCIRSLHLFVAYHGKETKKDRLPNWVTSGIFICIQRFPKLYQLTYHLTDWRQIVQKYFIYSFRFFHVSWYLYSNFDNWIQKNPWYYSIYVSQLIYNNINDPTKTSSVHFKFIQQVINWFMQILSCNLFINDIIIIKILKVKHHQINSQLETMIYSSSFRRINTLNIYRNGQEFSNKILFIHHFFYTTNPKFY